jgi:hypothetical protein
VVDSVETLQGGDFSTSDYGYITVTCYHHYTTANTICAGGGDFDRIPGGTSPCPLTGTANNGATIIQDAAPHFDCFYRKNFGLNGVVDARQCGVWGDGADHTPSDGAALQTCLNLAAKILAGFPPNIVPVVNTGGGVILDNWGDITIPDNITLTCGGTSVTQANANDYRTPALSKAIVLDPTHVNETGQFPAAGYTIRLKGMNSALEGCTIEAGAGPTGIENPYSPSIWFPNCKPDSAAGTCDLDTCPHEQRQRRRVVLRLSTPCITAMSPQNTTPLSTYHSRE